jgi:single-stranded DNA-specific DHH superfamily exonuclease
MKNNEKTLSSLTLGEIVDAIDSIIVASKLLGAQKLSEILTAKSVASHDETYIKALELAGERAKTIQQDQWQEANKHRISSCSPELTTR